MCIDTRLLVLSVGGQTGEELIAKYKRPDSFRIEDYWRLLNLPFFRGFRALINGFDEGFVQSTAASGNRRFIRLGLTDAALLEIVSKSTPLANVDAQLYLAATEIDSEAAYNFRHYQEF